MKSLLSELYGYAPERLVWDGSEGVTWFETRVTIQTVDGRIFEDCVRPAEMLGSDHAYGKNEEKPGETILQAMKRLKLLWWEVEKVVIEISFYDDSDKVQPECWSERLVWEKTEGILT
ncbi:MAG: hypothetical protein ABC596_05975, partial [Candidatus Methanosuratincola petrocarbonis]